MNGRQAAKAAAKKIEELEFYNAKCKADITAYNRIITGMIAGELSPCDWCEDQEECERQVKGTGCSEWWLMFNLPEMKEDATDDSEGVLPASIQGGEGT